MDNTTRMTCKVFPVTSGVPGATGGAQWTFLTNHGHVLLCVARDPGSRLRDIAALVGITERATQRIVADLVAAGYLQRIREGRRNRYQVRPDRPMRHPVEQPHRIGEVLEALGGDDAGSPGACR